MAQAAEPLPGRTAQCAAADRLLAAAAGGAGGALVLHGGPGGGKTALLDWAGGWGPPGAGRRPRGAPGAAGRPLPLPPLDPAAARRVLLAALAGHGVDGAT